MDIFDSYIANGTIIYRGLHDNISPENSIGAIKKAIAKGYALELDLRMLTDGTIVVFHDERLGRMTKTDGFLSNCSYDDIKGLTLLKSDEHIPTLAEVLKVIDGQVPVIFDIKNIDMIGVEKNVWKALKPYKGEYAIQSVNPYTLEWFKCNAPAVKRGQLASFFKGEKGKDLSFRNKFRLKRLMLCAKVSEPNFISYDADNLPNRFVKKFAHLPILAWKVSDAETLDRVKGCTSNIIYDGIDPETINIAK
ncbi:MAG: glycerophosphodiester phosphodiesterase [Clostridia bacterium]|nr:glycerophosphodiester phosphodiesterase [Clostridia bacterium]